MAKSSTTKSMKGPDFGCLRARMWFRYGVRRSSYGSFLWKLASRIKLRLGTKSKKGKKIQNISFLYMYYIKLPRYVEFTKSWRVTSLQFLNTIYVILWFSINKWPADVWSRSANDIPFCSIFPFFPIFPYTWFDTLCLKQLVFR